MSCRSTPPSPPWSCCSRIQSLVFLFVSPVGQYVVSILTGFRRLLGGLYARAIMGPRRMYTVSLLLKEMTSLCISTCFWTGFYRYLIVFQHQHKSVLFFQIKKKVKKNGPLTLNVYRKVAQKLPDGTDVVKINNNNWIFNIKHCNCFIMKMNILQGL